MRIHQLKGHKPLLLRPPSAPQALATRCLDLLGAPTASASAATPSDGSPTASHSRPAAASRAPHERGSPRPHARHPAARAGAAPTEADGGGDDDATVTRLPPREAAGPRGSAPGSSPRRHPAGAAASLGVLDLADVLYCLAVNGYVLRGEYGAAEVRELYLQAAALPVVDIDDPRWLRLAQVHALVALGWAGSVAQEDAAGLTRAWLNTLASVWAWQVGGPRCRRGFGGGWAGHVGGVVWAV